MDNITRRDNNMAYCADQAVLDQQKATRHLTQVYNTMDRSDYAGLEALLHELFGAVGDHALVNPPFYCDYGWNIKAGKNLFVNYNCTILDVAEVTLGDNVWIAPNVAIYTAGHPIHPVSRLSGYEYGIPVHIGDNVWIGGNVVILPGVDIGDNAVIAAGSVVTKSVPAGVIAAGNPAKVLRAITEEDKRYLSRGVPFDPEAWAVIAAMESGSCAQEKR